MFKQTKWILIMLLFLLFNWNESRDIISIILFKGNLDYNLTWKNFMGEVWIPDQRKIWIQ